MSKLIRANFTRLWKSRIFWIGILYTFAIGLFAVISPYRESLMYADYNPHFDNFLYTNCMFMPIVCAVFVGLFIGVEYSSGAIRNKIIVGHTRSAVYFSNLIVSAVAVIIMQIVNLAIISVLGSALIGNRGMPIGYLFMLGSISCVTLIALVAFFLLLCMLIGSRSNASVTAIIISFVFLMAALMINSKLAAPEYYPTYTGTYIDESGEVHEESFEERKNPHYVTGVEREVYEFLYDFLPGCQMVQIAQQEAPPEKAAWLAAYSLLIAALSTAGGVFFFRKKNLN